MAQKKKAPAKKKLPVPAPPWKPKDYKELVQWYVVQIESGGSVKREFLNHAKVLLAVKEEE